MTRPIAKHSHQKAYYIGRYAETAATVTKSPNRAYIYLFAGPGVCEEKDTRRLTWGSGLVALQVWNRFDLYVLNDIDPATTSALASRVSDFGVPGAAIFEVDLRQPDVAESLIDIGRVVAPFGPKIVITTGDANRAPFQLQPLLASLGRRRYILGIIDPTSAMFEWEVVHLALLRSRSIKSTLVHPVVLLYQVDEDAQERHQDREDQPPRLAQTREVGAAEDVSPDPEQQHEPHDPDEEDEHRPEHVEERITRG